MPRRIMPLMLAASVTAAAAAPGDAGLMDKAQLLFEATAAATCDTDDNAGEPPQAHAIGFRYSYDAEEDPERTAHLFRFFCFSGAYNEIHVYFLADEDGTVSPLHFAEPDYDVDYAGDSDETVTAITITGFSTTAQLVNSAYDPQTRTITAHSLWRGMGDASAHGRWVFANGGFHLVRYEVDASYDGEVNAQTIVDYGDGE